MGVRQGDHLNGHARPGVARVARRVRRADMRRSIRRRDPVHDPRHRDRGTHQVVRQAPGGRWMSTSASRRARCSASSGRTAPARRRPSDCCLGFLRPSSGRAIVLGHDAWSDAPAAHERISFVSSEPGYLGRPDGAAQLEYMARLRGLPTAARGGRSRSASSSTRASPSGSCRAAIARRSASSRRSWAGSRCCDGRADERARPAHAT